MRVGHGRRPGGRGLAGLGALARRRSGGVPSKPDESQGRGRASTKAAETEHKDPTPDEAASTKRARRRRRSPALPALLLVLALGLGALSWAVWSGAGRTMGATVTTAEEGMTRDEIQALLDEEVRANMMTVSVLPTMRLDPSTHELAVGAENVSDNRFYQRFTLTQGSRTLWTSGAVPPGERIESVVAPLAEEGEARMEVQALDPETKGDHGSPTAIEVSIAAQQAD